MPELTPSPDNGRSAPLPPGVGLILGFFYVLTASVGLLLLGAAYIWSDSPNSTDTAFLLLISLLLLFLAFLGVKAIRAVHRRDVQAPGLCRTLLATLVFLLALLFLGLCWLAAVFLSWPGDLPLFLGWVGLPALAVFLSLAFMYRYLKRSPLVRVAFNGGAHAPEGEAGGFSAWPADASMPPGVVLFLAACAGDLLFRSYGLFRILMYSYNESGESVFAGFSPFLLQDGAILLLVCMALYACIRRPARALVLVQATLWVLLAYEAYWLLHLFLEEGVDAFEVNGFVWVSACALSAGAFLLYFKTSALARAFLTTPPRRLRQKALESKARLIQ